MGLLDRLLNRNAPPEAPPLDDGERVVAWGVTTDGRTALATNRYLRYAVANNDNDNNDKGDADEPATTGWEHLGWAEIHKAAWADHTLTVTPGVEVEPGVVADGRVVRLRLKEPRDLPAEVRTRVTSSVAHTSQHRLRGGGSVRVVARRVPGVDGLTWQLRFEEGADRTDTASRAEAEGVLTEVRAQATPN